ncbi:MAG: UDP-N-acetylglucosamine--N-acetylmuramyl-(pentapeptide) pyrophosphoryl-undecaprenol N-acetylglucosamine transferase [Kiritimatiellia bacterium]
MTVDKGIKIAIACGGTGGHVFPGIAVAEALRERGHTVTLWLGGRNIETVSAGAWRGSVRRVRAVGFPGRLSLYGLYSIWVLLKAWYQCRRLLGRDRPQVLLGMGSYSAAPPALAARSLGIPLVLHEGNAVPGRANSFLSRYAAAIGTTFDTAARYFDHSVIKPVGFPLRKEMENPREPLFGPGDFTLLVLGGSQGAMCLNRVVPDAVRTLCGSGVRLRVIHVTGVADEGAVRRVYERSAVEHVTADFLKEMDRAYGCSDFAVARAGAGTCCELAAFGVPALLVPLSSAPRDHQRANARAMRAAGCAEVQEEKDLTPAGFAKYMRGMIDDPEKRRKMSEAGRSLAAGGSADRLADLVESVVKKHEKTTI